MLVIINNVFISVWQLVCGTIFMFCLYTISLIINIRIKKGEYGLTSGRFKLCFIAALFGVCCNMVDYVLRNTKVTDNVWIAKIVLLFVILYKIYSLSDSGNPLWVTGDEWEQNENPFDTTVGMSFSIMIAYMLPMGAAIFMAIVMSFVSSVINIEKYKFIRILPMSIINTIEIVLVTILVKVSYRFDFIFAVLSIATLGAIFNIVFAALNDIVFDYFTGDKYFQ